LFHRAKEDDYELNWVGESAEVREVWRTYTTPATPDPPQTVVPPALNWHGHAWVAAGVMIVVMIGLAVYHVADEEDR